MVIRDSGTLLDRLAASRKAREAELAANRRAPVTAVQRLGLPYAPGDRVFDTVSGEHGTVERAAPAGKDSQPLVYVRTDRGTLYARDASKLIDRPSER